MGAAGHVRNISGTNRALVEQREAESPTLMARAGGLVFT